MNVGITHDTTLFVLLSVLVPLVPRGVVRSISHAAHDDQPAGATGARLRDTDVRCGVYDGVSGKCIPHYSSVRAALVLTTMPVERRVFAKPVVNIKGDEESLSKQQPLLKSAHFSKISTSIPVVTMIVRSAFDAVAIFCPLPNLPPSPVNSSHPPPSSCMDCDVGRRSDEPKSHAALHHLP